MVELPAWVLVLVVVALLTAQASIGILWYRVHQLRALERANGRAAQWHLRMYHPQTAAATAAAASAWQTVADELKRQQLEQEGEAREPVPVQINGDTAGRYDLHMQNGRVVKKP